PRITGTEVEWGLLQQTYPNPSLTGELGEPHYLQAMDNAILARHMPPYLFGKNKMYSNGGKFYVDLGNHPETATCEDDSFLGTLANEIAGEEILREALDEWVRHSSSRDDVVYGYKLNKRVIDDAGRSWGYHENYLASSDQIEINEKHLALLG